jgi:hypothetical protein
MHATVETEQQALIREAAKRLGLPLPDLRDPCDCARWIEVNRAMLRRFAASCRRFRAISEFRLPDADRKLAAIYARKRRARKGLVAPEWPHRAGSDNRATEAQIALVDRLFKGMVQPTSGTHADRLIKMGLAYQAEKSARMRARRNG